jgi:hypothetical protein
MNNTFSFRRFGWLFRKTILERPMQILGMVLLSLVNVFFIYVISKFLSGFDVAQNAAFMIGLIGGGCFLAAQIYNYFNSNAMGSSFLTLPASHLEKWLCGVLIAGVLYLLIFLGFFRVMDQFFVDNYHAHLDKNSPFYKELYEAVEVFAFDGFVAAKAFILYANFAGAMLIGAFYFNKLNFIKVALLICGFWVGSWVINLLIASVMMQHVQNALPYWVVFIKVNDDEGRLELPGKMASVVKVFIAYIIPITLWALAYLRLREKEF